MNWHTDKTWVDEYVDTKERRQGADAARMVDAHLATCDRCRALVADVQAIRAMSRSLEPHVPPPHVWTKLAAALEAEPKGRSLFSLSAGTPWRRSFVSAFGLQQAAALAMAMVLGTGLWWIGGRLSPASGRSLNVQAPIMTAGIAAVPMQFAEEQFTNTIAGLQQMTRERQDALDADTIGVVQANLSVIDAAITESRAVLETEPESALAQQSLFEALRRKVALLQDILALINEMRKGDPDGAARIVSGLNQ